MKVVKNIEITKTLFNETLAALKNEVMTLLKPVAELFTDTTFAYAINGRSANIGSAILEVDLIPGENIHELGFQITLNGFKKGGLKSFNRFFYLKFFLEKYKYLIGSDRQSIWEEHLYDKQWSASELHRLAETWVAKIIEEVSTAIEGIA